MNDTASGFLQKLRAETAFCHSSVEQLPISAMLLNEQVNLEYYAGYLKRMYGFVSRFEQLVYPVCVPVITDATERFKTIKLSSDLSLLGIQPDTIELIDADMLNRYYSDIFCALGGMYVMEGSTLGGQIISRHVSKAIGPGVEHKLAYLQAYGDRTGSKWKSFIGPFSDAVIQNKKEDIVIQSAIHTFQLLEKWLDSNTIS